MPKAMPNREVWRSAGQIRKNEKIMENFKKLLDFWKIRAILRIKKAIEQSSRESDEAGSLDNKL